MFVPALLKRIILAQIYSVDNPFSLTMRKTVYILTLIALGLTMANCSSTRKPLRPAVKQKKRHCDCSHWGYVMPDTGKTTSLHARG